MSVLYRNAAVADARSAALSHDQSILVVDGRIEFLGLPEDEPTIPSRVRIIDAGGSTVVPGLVDAHSHTVLPGGSHWIERIDDATAELLQVAEENGELAHRAGVRWFRDVGSPRRDGRGLALDVRDAWTGRRDRPYVRAAGTWIAGADALPPGIAIEAEHADALVAAVEMQIEEGADLIKLYLDGPDRDLSPWTSSEVARCVAAAHMQSVPVTAHSTTLPGARAGVLGGVDCIEHGTELDEALVGEIAARGTYLVPTLGVLASWQTFGSTTRIERFTSHDGRSALKERRRRAYESVQMAHAAGARIAAGTDFGGGSLRANQLAWEAECLVAAGLEPWEALAAATWRGGDLLRESTAGRIAVGGPADFFLVHGNPVEDVGALWRVWRVA